MKLLRLIFLIAPLLAARAQPLASAGQPPVVAGTNAPVPPQGTNASPRAPARLYIESDHFEAYLNERTVVYSSNVVVTDTDPKLRMTCDTLTIRASTNSASTNSSPGLRPDGGVAEGHVVIAAEDEHGRPINVQSDKGIYTYKVVNSVTNETITLTNNVIYDSAMGKGTADWVVWDRIKNTIHMETNHMFLQPDAVGSTNAPAVKTASKPTP